MRVLEEALAANGSCATVSAIGSSLDRSSAKSTGDASLTSSGRCHAAGRVVLHRSSRDWAGS